MEVGQEDRLDPARVDAQAVQVREQGGAGVEQETPVDAHRPVVTLEAERRPGAEKRQFQAMVTEVFR